MQLDHDNVIKLLGAGINNLTIQETSHGDKFFVVSELATKGELFTYIQICSGLGQTKSPFCR
jgi:hypothetical protein